MDMAVTIPQRILRSKGEGLIVLMGNTRGTLERNILEPMRSMWTNCIGNIRSDNTLEMFGKKVYALGADNKRHVARIQGATFEYVYGDELTTWSEDVFQMLKSRLRCEHSHFDGTCNPDNPNHWVRQFLDSDADIYCQTYVIDDGVLPESVVRQLKTEYAGTIFYDRYINGLWVAATGLVYPLFDKTVEDVPDGDPQKWVMSIDYGTQNAFSAGLWGQYGETWWRVREYYYSGRDSGVQKTDEEYAQDLDRFTDGLCDPYRKMRVVIDPSAASFIALLRKRGIYHVIQADNAVLDGIRETATAMQGGRIRVSPSCTNWLKEASGYVWDDCATDDRPVKVNDHAMDETRYFVKTMGVAKPKRRY